MAINSNSSMPSVKKVTVVQHLNPDGTVRFEYQHADQRTVDAQGNLEMFKVTPVVTLACHHTWPPTQPFAACEQCQTEGLANPYVCKDDFHRCLECQRGCCPVHARPSPDETEKGWLCLTCYSIRKHGWLLHAIQRWFKT